MPLRLAAAALLMLFAAPLSIAAADERLVPITTRTIDLAGTGVSIDLSKAPGSFRGIVLRGKHGTAHIGRVQIVYADGSVLNEDLPLTLTGGAESPTLGKSVMDGFIDTVNIANSPATGLAVVEVLGLQTPEGAAKTRPAPATGDVTAGRAGTLPDRTVPGTVGPDSDVMFGYKNVGFGIDRDVIKVGGDLGKFSRIRLRVLGNDVHINALRVVFVDGAEQKLAVDADIQANARSQWLEVDGSRFIREIEMTYRSQPSLKGQARVEVTGEYADGWLGADGEGRKYHEGWVLLGAQTAGFTGFDRDTIVVGGNEGGFSRLRLAALDRAITLKEIRVKYYSGPDELFRMHERVDPGKPYGPLEFKGGKAPIRAIEARYRSRFDLAKGLKSAFNGRPAVVQIWGQH
jgi:hypothetical protein